MKVLMFGWEFPPFATGGLGTHCYGLTKGLAGRGVEITFVMPGTPADVNYDWIKIIQAGKEKLIQIASRLKPYIPSLHFGFWRSGGKRGGSPAYNYDFFEEVKRYTDLAVSSVTGEKFDIIHSHDWMTFPAGMAMKKETGKPLVVTVHSTEFDRTGSLSPNPWITKIEWEGMYEADKIITVSNYEKRQIMEKYSVPGEKIEVVHNAVTPEDYRGGRIKFGLKDRIVLFLGRMTLQKGPDHLLNAVKKVLEKEKRVKFVFVGAGDMLPELINMSINMGVSENVIFTGYQESILEYYKVADLVVMPSVSDPFGIVALEAMASGTPVIVSKQSGVSEAVKHRMVVDFWDADGLASKIIGVLRYDSLRKEMGTNGFKEVQGINWLKAADRTIGVYSGLLNPS